MSQAHSNLSDQLLFFLQKIPALRDSLSRNMLLRGLPPSLVDTISRSSATLTDLSNIVQVTSSSGKLASGEFALAVVMGNARVFVRGLELEKELEELLAELEARSAAPPVSVAPSPGRQICILHMSDIHLGTNSEARTYRTQLQADLIRELDVSQLDYLVISGDIANRSTPGEYEAACELLEGLIKRFGLDADRIIIAPGNHDLNWELSKQAYTFYFHDDLPDPLPEGRFISAGDAGKLLCDEPQYQQRFVHFAHFYESICGDPYPLDYAQQGILYPYPDDRLLFLALNSAWEIDHHKPRRERSGINSDALAYALERLLDNEYDHWLKIAVWHHPTVGPEMIKNVGFLEQLSVNGFQICMHGHIHEAIEGYHKYDDKRGLRIIGAGTFGAPLHKQAGIPLQYNLLILDPEARTITVKTRRKEKPNGAWFADARWGDRNNPKAWYTIPLK